MIDMPKKKQKKRKRESLVNLSTSMKENTKAVLSMFAKYCLWASDFNSLEKELKRSNVGHHFAMKEARQNVENYYNELRHEVDAKVADIENQGNIMGYGNVCDSVSEIMSSIESSYIPTYSSEQKQLHDYLHSDSCFDKIDKQWADGYTIGYCLEKYGDVYNISDSLYRYATCQPPVGRIPAGILDMLPSTTLLLSMPIQESDGIYPSDCIVSYSSEETGLVFDTKYGKLECVRALHIFYTYKGEDKEESKIPTSKVAALIAVDPDNEDEWMVFIFGINLISQRVTKYVHSVIMNILLYLCDVNADIKIKHNKKIGTSFSKSFDEYINKIGVYDVGNAFEFTGDLDTEVLPTRYDFNNEMSENNTENTSGEFLNYHMRINDGFRFHVLQEHF